MFPKRSPQILLLILALAAALLAQTARHPLKLDDIARLRDVRGPQVSPDGQWVAYVVSTIDTKEDKSNSHIWMVSFDGKSDRQITFSQDSESSPRWSPDGNYLSFTSSRPGKAKGNQIWLLDRKGGEAMQLTEFKGRLQGYEWAPDSKRLAAVIGDPDPEAEAAASPAPGPPKPPKPIVIDRYRYKQDGQGYLLSGRHSYIYLYDIDSKKLERLTSGKWDESSMSWSPDGRTIAFMSNHSDDPDRDPSAQLFVAEAKPAATEKQLTVPTNRAGRSRPEWSPDGKWLVVTEGDERKYGAYSMDRLLFVPADGSSAPAHVKAVDDLDRGVSGLRFGVDTQSLTVLVTDDRSVYPVSVSRNTAKRLMEPPVVVSNLTSGGGHVALLSGNDTKPTDVYAMEGGTLRQLTHQNDALLSELELGATEEVGFKSKDGTEVHGLLTYPVGYVKGSKVRCYSVFTEVQMVRTSILSAQNGSGSRRMDMRCWW